MKRIIAKSIAFCLILALLFSAVPAITPSASAATNNLETQAGTHTYQLFNSGNTGSKKGSSSTNTATTTLTNNSNDIYLQYFSDSDDCLNAYLGLSFTVTSEVTEQAVLTINAYDVDENANGSKGPERDYLYLVDTTTGTKQQIPGYLSGMNEQWNTTTLRIDPSMFTVGHTYRIQAVDSIWGFNVWIRSVSIQITTEGVSELEITDHRFSADISSSGLVTTSLYLQTNKNVTYYLEYAATCGNNQYGSSLNQSVQATPSGVTKAVSFQLESGAPEGNYQVDVILKDASGNVKEIYTVTTSGPDNSTVNYDANGGSNNLPTDYNIYHSGNTVTVQFNYIPSKYGFVFLGWARTANAAEPEFTATGTKSFTIGNQDVTLYAVWAKEHMVCVPGSWITDQKPTCTEPGSKHTVCTECGETLQSAMISALGHDYIYTKTVAPTCTAEGYDLYTCNRTGCGDTKQQAIGKVPHNYGGDNVCDECGHTIPVAHTHSYTAVTVAPTCTTMGYTEYTCSCGHSYRNDYIENLAHTWNETVTKKSTCSTDGIKTYACQKCSASFTEIIPAAHQWQETITKPATCTADGENSRVCAACGEKETVIIPAAHSWNAGNVIKEATCTEEGVRIRICSVCGEEENEAIEPLGHTYVNRVCTRCGSLFIDNVTSDTQHPEYGMYFCVDDVKSGYGPDLINEYGVLLDYNEGAQLKKVGVYLTQDGTMWRRCIACVGDNITYATYVPYLSYGEDIKYTGLNSQWINTFRLSPNSLGVWCYGDYATIGVNLEDAYGNLLLSLYDIGQAGAKTRIFDDLDEMKAWLAEPSDCIAHTEGEWIVDVQPTVEAEGQKHTECVICGAIVQSQSIPKLVQLCVEKVEASADAAVKVSVSVLNNPGILGATLTVNYNPSLTLVKVENGSAWSELDFTEPGELTAPCKFLWDGISNAGKTDGSVLELTFQVSPNAQIGDVYEITVTYENDGIVDEALQPVSAVVVNGGVTVVAPVILGDLGGDGVISIDDVVLLRRLIAGGYTNLGANAAAADINKDGKIDITDVILLRRYIAGGYGVELG